MSRIRVPEAGSTALQISAGRTAIAAALMAAPELTVRMLGADTATARRVTWLTRMLAVRDGAIGVGGLLAVRRGGAAPWLLAGAVSDAVDAVVIAGALRRGRIGGALASLAVPGGAGAAAAGAITALQLRRSA